MTKSAEQYEAQLGFIRRLQGLARSVAASRPMKSLREKVCLTFLARATVSSESVCVLFASGLEPDARSVTRTIAELAIDLAWLVAKDDEERLDLFIEYVHVLNHRRLASIGTLSKHPGRPPDAERAFAVSGASAAGFSSVEEFTKFQEAEYERVKAKYPNKSRWNPDDLAKRSKEVGLEVLYETAYRMGCEAVHSGPATMTGLLREGDDGQTNIVLGPATPEDDTTLVGAAWGYLFLIEISVATLDPTRKAELEPLATEFGRLFG
jgi:Family of unknown function (DUF5677)